MYFQTKDMQHVVIIGLPGAGKSSLVNMLCPGANAKVSNDLEGCTKENQSYSCQLDGRNYKVHDTVGIPEGGSWMSKVPFLKRFAKSHDTEVNLKQYLNTKLINHGDGSPHLLVFCMSGLRCRFQKASQSEKYKMFKSFVSPGSVPVVLVVTGLDEQRDSWWTTNARFLQNFDQRDGYHACITTIHGNGYDGSRRDVESLIRRHLGW